MCQLLTSPSSRIVLSRPFSFIADADEVLIMVYVAVVADKCPALDSLMRGEMSESLAGEAKWKDMGQGTFLRFIEFAYTGDYSIPQSSIVKASDQHLEQDLYTDMVKEDGMPQEVFPSPPEHWVNWGVSSSKKDKKRRATGEA